ncbi:unnamed protein product [Sphagnum jensenii]|uniref:Dehydrin n=1 Tax=Sphagnum jensenii TaxID=128206 RepID=A0ABP0W670_9BRYO
MADNSYNNNQGSDSMETQTDQGQQDFGVTDPTNVNTGVGPTGTDDAVPRDFSSEGPGMPKNYQGGDDQQGQYPGDQQQQPNDSGYGAANGGGDQQSTGAGGYGAANGGGDQQSTGAGGYGAGDTTAQQGSNYQNPSAAAAPGSYSDKSAVGGTNAGTGTYNQPTSDQSQAFGQDNTGAADDESTGAEAPKKEGFLTKLKEKLPGHHKSTDEDQTDATAYTGDNETGEDGQAPKKGLITKIKEKVHM